MSLNSYANIQAAIADILARSDLTSQIVDAITIFEADAAFELFKTRGAETRTILVPTVPTALTITNAANNGSGLIRLTYSGTASPTIATGDIIAVSSVSGTTEANGSWVVTVISSSSLDLQGSTFTNTYTSGGQIQQDVGFAALPSDYLGWSRVTSTGVPTVDLEYVAPGIWDQEFPVYTPVVQTDIARVFTVEDGYLKIKPTNTTPLEFLYWAKTAALSSSFNWLATSRPDAYLAGALEALYLHWIKDPAQAAMYRAKKEEIYSKIKTQRFREFSGLRIRIDRSSYGATP